MKHDLISVIVPVYNVERYLDKCIESICNQSYQHLEILLCDDCSTDTSGTLCDAWVKKDSRIRVIHKENGGLSDARNAGIEAAHGRWLSFIDSDDFITPDTLERLYTAATKNRCQIAVCNIRRIYEDGTTEAFYTPAREETVYRGDARFATLQQPSVCNKLFLAELFANLLFPKGKFYEDTFVYHILAHGAEAIALTGHDGYYYLSRQGSILGQPTFTDRYFDCIEAVYQQAQYLMERQIPFYAEEACQRMYITVHQACRHLPETAHNRDRFQTMWQWYGVAYRHLMHHPATSLKMKLRLVLLKHLPKLHNKLYK
jgi:glycosyltransferase involved in cell wall biosynthesis